MSLSSFHSPGPERMSLPFSLRLMRIFLASPRSWSVGSIEATRARGRVNGSSQHGEQPEDIWERIAGTVASSAMSWGMRMRPRVGLCE
jgi:hypothetical protein